MTMFKVFFTASLFLISASATFAQNTPVYKGVDEKGHIVYANSSKGLRNAQKIIIPEPAISGTVAPLAQSVPVVTQPIPDATVASVLDTRSALVAAQSALIQSLADQDLGKEPLPGERLGTSTGGSRLAPSYFSRQDDLSKAVQASRALVDQAASAR